MAMASNGNGKYQAHVTDGVERLSRQEIISCLEAESRRRLNMSARQLLKNVRQGRIPDLGRIADLISLSKLLRKNDPIFAE